MTEEFSRRDNISELLKNLPESETTKLLVGLLREAARDAVRDALPEPLRDFFNDLGESEGIPALLNEISAKTGAPGFIVLRKALTLYNVAWEAEEEGNRIAILTPDDEIDRDIVGIHSSETTAISHAR